MADFPRIKWLNIDGQQVPFTEPQHFTGSGDETARTGHDNPLPVANYTKKGNIWLPVSEENPVPTQVTGSNVAEGIPVQVEKDFIEVIVQGDELEAGKRQTFDVYSHEGEIWTLKRFGYYADRNRELTGNHSIRVHHGDRTSNDNSVLEVKNDVNQYMRGTIPGRRGVSFSGDITPDDNYEMVEAMRDTTVLSNVLPLRVQYINQGDGTLPGLRLTLFFMVERVNNIGS